MKAMTYSTMLSVVLFVITAPLALWAVISFASGHNLPFHPIIALLCVTISGLILFFFVEGKIVERMEARKAFAQNK